MAEELSKKGDIEFSEEERRGAHPLTLRIVRELYRLGSMIQSQTKYQFEQARKTPADWYPQHNLVVPDPTLATLSPRMIVGQKERETVVITNTGGQPLQIGRHINEALIGFQVLPGQTVTLDTKRPVYGWVPQSGELKTTTVDTLETLYEFEGKQTDLG